MPASLQSYQWTTRACCSVCPGCGRAQSVVLWPQLRDEWAILPITTPRRKLFLSDGSNKNPMIDYSWPDSGIFLMLGWGGREKSLESRHNCWKWRSSGPLQENHAAIIRRRWEGYWAGSDWLSIYCPWRGCRNLCPWLYVKPGARLVHVYTRLCRVEFSWS